MWTNEQNLAINKRGSNIIVSAGAGSGKTAVLAERILKYCLAGGDIRRVLVLTFTNAAASEMKERIRKNLLKNGLNEQADYIDASDITTFDAYSLGLVKKYAYKFNISSNLQIMDEALLKIKRKEITNSLFEELYNLEDKRFLSYLEKYSKQDDKEVVNIVLKLCDRLDLIIDFDSFKKNYEKNYFSIEKINRIADEYEIYAKEAVNEFESELNELLKACSYDNASIKLYDGIKELLTELNALNGYENYYRFFNDYSLPRTSPKALDSVKELKEKCNNILKELKANIFGKYVFVDDMKAELLATKDDVLFLLDICEEVNKRLMDYKKSIMQFAYMDIAKFALRLVKEFDDVYCEVKSSYSEILVDEYQDTSDIQEAFLKIIADNNLYMVGDIKQSIYRFRNANPYIFKEKYDKYSKKIDGIKIDLLANFRSREEVINNINYVFEKLMTDSCGDANYELDHRMCYGQKEYERLKQDANYNMQILTYEPDGLEEFSQEEKEAFIVAGEIKKIVNSGIKVLTKNGYKDIDYADFAILIDKSKTFVTFKRIFEYLNIPLSIEADLDLKDSIIPKLFSNIIMIISKIRNNCFDTKYGHALAAVARSFLYEYDDNMIFKLLNGEKYEIMADFNYLAEKNNLSYKQLFYEIIFKLKIYDKLSLIGLVDESVVVLEYIYKMFMMFESASFSLDEATKYLVDIFDSDLKLSYKLPASASKSVRIMTIHKSKGLEFPYCFYPMLSTGFNMSDAKAQIGFHKDYGIYIPFVDEGKSGTIVSKLIEKNIRHADISEHVRLLYVAMTRAREKMIMIVPNLAKPKDNPQRFSNFAEMLEYAKAIKLYGCEIDVKYYNPTSNYKFSNSISIEINGKEILNYEPLPKPKAIIKKQISKEMHTIPSKELKKKLELGLRFHSALESLDLANPNFELLPVDDFIKDKLKLVLANPIFKDIKKGKSYHEHEFYFTKNLEAYHGIIDLFVVYEDHIDIIDYKLANTDSIEYIRQLSIYKEYIKTKWDKLINVYLLSLLKAEIKKIEI